MKAARPNLSRCERAHATLPPLANRWLRASIALVAFSFMSLPAHAQCLQWRGQGGHSGLNGIVRASAVYDDGTGPALFVGGEFTTAGGLVASGVAKWDGERWSALGDGIPLSSLGYDLETFTVGAMLVHDDGSGPSLFVGGNFKTAGGVVCNHIAKWNGLHWAPLGTGLSNVSPEFGVRALAIHDDGSGPALFVGGAFDGAGDTSARNLAKWDGSAWTAIGTSAVFQSSYHHYVGALHSFDDGSGSALFLGGGFDPNDGTGIRRVAKWNGSSFVSVGGGLGFKVNVLAVFDAGTGSGPQLYAGGSIYSSSNDVRLARLVGGSWLDAYVASSSGAYVADLIVHDAGDGDALYVAGSSVQRFDGTALSVVPNAPGSVLSLAEFGGKLYLGGRFDGPVRSFIVRRNGAVFEDLEIGSGLDAPVRALASHDDGSGRALYVGGEFTGVRNLDLSRIGRLRGSQWSAVGTGFNAAVLALHEYDDGLGGGARLFAGGSFTQADGTTAVGIAAWDGTQWSSVGGGLGVGATVKCMATYDDGTGPALYVAGVFATASDVPARNIARWNGVAWTSVGPGLGTAQSRVNALHVHDDGQGGGPQLYAGGQLTTSGSGGGAAGLLARWNGAQWSAVGSSTLECMNLVAVQCPEQINALATFDDGTGPALYIGGLFTNVGFLLARNVAKWNGVAWSPANVLVCGNCFDNYPLCEEPVMAMHIVDDGTGMAPRLFAGGTFCPGGLLQRSGQIWDDSDGTDGFVYAMAMHDDGTDGVPDLYIGGDFTRVGGCAAGFLAQRVSCAPTPGTPFCFGDGSLATACPCALPSFVPNPSGSPSGGCANRWSRVGARLYAIGETTLDSVSLHGDALPPAAFAQFLKSDAVNSAGIPFSDGVQCVDGNIVRFGSQNAVNGRVRYPTDGALPVSVVSGTPSGSAFTAHYQIVYRDPDVLPGFCTPGALNLSNAYTIVW
ncbi:MAG: hypothetical protein ACKVWV_08140 [Planctomycetota bacterium]